MEKIKLSTFTFIGAFRDGTYCTQVQAENVHGALTCWIEKLKLEKEEIQYLDDKIIEELQTGVIDKDNQPSLLNGLKNVWYTLYTTKGGSFSINIIQTDVGN